MKTNLRKKQRNRKLNQRFKKLQQQQQALGSKPMNGLCDNPEQQLSEEEQNTQELQHITNQLIKLFNR